MLLSARPLADVQSVNSFRVSTGPLTMTAGDAPVLYYQLVDVSLDTVREGFNPSGRRYMPLAGATLTMNLLSIDTAKQVSRAATQPFAQDPSVWSVQMFATDTILGTVALQLVLTEGARVTRGLLQPALLISPQSASFTPLNP